jgi:hypothetical protein
VTGLDRFAAYQAAVAEYAGQHPEQRTGQAHFNVLHRLHPDVADRARGDRALDPFHVDERLPLFLVYVEVALSGAL